MPLPKYKERRASVCAYLCISIVGRKVLKFRETIALQLDVFFAELKSLSRLSTKPKYYIIHCQKLQLTE